MSLVDLVRLREALDTEELPKDADTITALRLPTSSRYHLGRTHKGELCALIETQGGARGPDVRLRNLEVRQAIRCRVKDPGSVEQVVEGSLVVCRAAQPALLDLFLRLYADAVLDLGPAPTSITVADWLAQLAALMSRLEQEGRRRLQGLWAELLVIRHLGEPMLLLRRWRPDMKERYDFLASGFALEVKSCQDFDRVHQFSLDQLRPPEGLDVWIASIVVRRDPAGISVLELLAATESVLEDPAARFQIREMTLATGGSALDDDDQFRFDVSLAQNSLRLLDVRGVPSMTGPVHEDILDVALRVRCDHVAEVGPSSEALRRLA